MRSADLLVRRSKMAEASNQGRRRRMASRSVVWQHFHRFTDDQGEPKARCKYCPTVLKADTKGGTSTLWNHFRKYCEVLNQNRQQQQQLTQELLRDRPSSSRPEEPLNPEPAHLEEPPLLIERPEPEEDGRGKDRVEGDEAVADLARMIALHGYDPSIVEDDYFRSCVRRLNPEFELPPRSDIEQTCDGIFDQERKDLVSKLRQRARKRGHSLAVGKAKTTIVDAVEVLHTTCHFIDDEWNLHRLVVDARVLVPCCCGVIYGSLLGLPIVDVDSLSDSSDVYDVMESVDSGVASVTDGTDPYANMPFIKVWRITDEPDVNMCIEETEGEWTISGQACTTYMDNVLHSVARCFHDLEDIELMDKIELPDLTRHEREKLLSDHDLEHQLAHQEGWYSYYFCLEHFVNEASATAADQETLETRQTMCSIWGAICRAIQTLSASRGPTSNLCLEELFKVREVLQTHLASGTRNNYLLSRFLAKAKEELDKSIQDLYLLWSMPLVLDPRYKLEFLEIIFNRAFGSEAARNYIAKVKAKMEDLYIDEYGGDDDDDDDSSDTAVGVGCSDALQQAWYEHYRAQDKTELDRYLNDSILPPTRGFDILNWWRVYGSHQYPKVAQMARDALAMPTCSKLSTEQMAHVRSIVRGYSKGPIRRGSEFQNRLRSS